MDCARRGVHLALELSFDYQGRVYLFNLRAEWFDDYLNLVEELDASLPDDDEDDDMGILFPELTSAGNERTLLADPPARSSRCGTARGRASLDPPAARVLLNRGYKDPASARRFLRPSLDDLHDPFLMLGMEQALERLRLAIARPEKILLYGDYDVDGTTAVVVVSKAIELAGGQSSYHIPNRLKDGYGMHPEAMEQAARDGVSLIISLDPAFARPSSVPRALAGHRSDRHRSSSA